MQAPDYETLFRQEEQVENAVKAILEPTGFAVNLQRDIKLDEKGNVIPLSTPRIDVQFALGASYNLHKMQDRFGNWWYDAWSGTLSCAVVTKRSKNNAEHGLMRAKVRRFMQTAEDKFTEAVLPYHKLSKIVESGTTPTVKTEDDCDDSTVTFSCIVAIRGDAWPSTQP